jgi:endo-1,4-beta-xylanase
MVIDNRGKAIRMNRREALLNGGRLLACTALYKRLSALAAQPGTAALTSLKTAGACSGAQIGIATDKSSLQDASLARLVVQNFDLITVSGLKWDKVHPGPDTYDFSEADWNMRFAEENGLKVHGHNLCWNSPAAYPVWFKSGLNRDNAKQFLTSHIMTVMKRYAGRIDSWDVVNEPTVPWSQRPGGLYPGVWLDFLGPTYIETAFHAAKAADPKPLRILNVYDVEQATPDQGSNRTATLELLKQLVARGVPVQAVGIESHLDASQPLGDASFRTFLDDIRALKLQVLITELDVKENRAVGDSRVWDATAAQYYEQYITEVRAAANPRFVIFWSLEDRWENGRRIQGLTHNGAGPRLTYSAAIRGLEKDSSC